MTQVPPGGLGRDELRREVRRILNHDIRTPLTALIGHTEMLRDSEDELPDDVMQSLGAIERAGWKLNEMVASVMQMIQQIEELDAKR